MKFYTSIDVKAWMQNILKFHLKQTGKIMLLQTTNRLNYFDLTIEISNQFSICLHLSKQWIYFILPWFNKHRKISQWRDINCTSLTFIVHETRANGLFGFTIVILNRWKMMSFSMEFYFISSLRPTYPNNRSTSLSTTKAST